MNGICASTGSACSSGNDNPSHVLLSIGLPNDIAKGSLRITFGKENTKEDVDYLIKVLIETVSKLRNMSPEYLEFIKNKL
jgi:cysteine desulfurase